MIVYNQFYTHLVLSYTHVYIQACVDMCLIIASVFLLAWRMSVHVLHAWSTHVMFKLLLIYTA